MRDDPNPEIHPDDKQFAGDNFARVTGEAIELSDTMLFAWDAHSEGVDGVHAQANPSQAELLKKQFKEKTANASLSKKRAVLDKYGGAQYLDGGDGLGGAGGLGAGEGEAGSGETVAQRNARFGVSVTAKEYSRDGRVVKGSGKQAVAKSKYEEDLHVNGHTTVYGSFFHKGAWSWGYRDDHSLLKSSYCTGEKGRAANDESNSQRFGTGGTGSAQVEQSRALLEAVGKAKGGSGAGGTGAGTVGKRSDLFGEGGKDVALDQEKLKAAIAKEEEFQRQAKAGGASGGGGSGKRKYTSMENTEVTAEEMEAYRLTKKKDGDEFGWKEGELLEYDKQN
jgi:pre-mRNA-processing factor SLU7